MSRTRVQLGFVSALGFGLVLWLWAGDALAKNLITNSSFEAGIDSRFAVGRWYVDGLPSARLDPTTKIHGRYSLKMPFSRQAYTPKPAKRRSMTLRSAIPIRVEKGRRYAFSLYMKTDVPAEGGVLVITPNSATGYKQAPLVTHQFQFSRAWRRTGVTFVAARDQEVYWEIRVAADRQGHLWLDALQMEEDAFTDYAPAGDIEASITSEATGRIYDSGGRPRINLLAYNNSGRTIAQSLWLDVYDVKGAAVWSTCLTHSLPANDGIRVPVDLPALMNGIYRSALRLEKGGEPVGELTFSVLPKPRKLPPDDSAFGVYLTIAPEPLAIARRIGLKWIATLTANDRMSSWKRVEPEPGRFLWYDEDVDLASKFGFKLMFNLQACRIPRWAKKFPAEEKLARWASFVRVIVSHYRNTVKYWTISDEFQNKRCWKKRREDYAKWHSAGYEAIKRTDPDAKVILNTSPRFVIVRRLFDTVSSNTVDILAANFYHLPAHGLREMKDLAAANGIYRIWAPGVGRLSQSFYRSHIPGAKRARYGTTYWHGVNVKTVKSVVRTLDIGIERLFHYTASYVGNTNKYSIFDDDSGLKPIGAQFAALIWLLDGIRTAKHLKTVYRENILSVSRFDRKDNRTVFAIWGRPSEKQRLTLRNLAGEDFVLYDQYANSLPLERRGRDVDVIFGRDPVFLVVPGHQGAATERALLSTRLYLDKLPDADRTDIKGRYAVAYGIHEDLSRPKENVSLWYKSSKLGWVEVMRQRTSQFPGQYGVTERGFSIAWTLGEARSQFFIEPGLIPANLADGAVYWRSRGIKGRLTWTKGRIDLASLEPRSSGKRLAGDPSAAPPTAENPDSGYNYVFKFQNGLVLDMETRFLTVADSPALATSSYGGWNIYAKVDKSKKDYQVFLHTYFGPSGKTRKILSLLRMREDSAQ